MATPRSIGITRSRLLEALNYDPHTGTFVWKIRPVRSKISVGDIAGAIYKSGYRYIQIDGTPYRACRLAWLYLYGEPIPAEVDHHNMNKSDDRACNLRPATCSTNQANRGLMATNTSGSKGVRWEEGRRKWIANITVNGLAKNLGRFLTKEEAENAYEVASIAAWGEFARS